MSIDIRDQFAMAAMQGFLTSGEHWNHNTIGRDSYDIADAMLVEREKNKGNVVLTQAKFSQLRAEITDCKQQLQALLEANDERNS